MKKVLELGCGQGFYTSILAKKYDVTGIDLSKKNIEIAKERYPHARFSFMNAEKLTFKSNAFDRVYALEVLEHVDNLKKVLSEVSRVLKINGYFIVSIPFYRSENLLLKLRPTYFKEIHHVRIFSDKELEILCRKYKLVLSRKERKGFLQHIELFFLFLRKNKNKSQVSIGSWRDNIFTEIMHATMLYFDPTVLDTPLIFFPIWIITIPFGVAINSIGNIFLPKSFYYEFVKK